MQRYVAEWTIFPRGPWIIIDTATGQTVKTRSGFFWHGTEAEMLRKLAKLNRPSCRV